MRIQHNIPAMNSYRNYSSNVSRVSKSLEKLSTGYRVNRAGDDAAGLAISEKMRIQMTGLEQAQTNARAGINLVQTAEGALTEVHDMLNRMYTLAEQSANGTYSDDVDREQLQKEIVSLRTEIDRIADATNYNGINLLDGSLATKETEAVSEAVAGTEMQDMAVTAAGATAVDHLAKAAGYTTGEITDRAKDKFDAVRITYTNAEGVEKVLTIGSRAKNAAAGTAGKAGEEIASAINDGTLEASVTDSNAKADLAEFLSTFNVTGDGNKLSISAKDPNSKAAVSKFEYCEEADYDTALTDLAVVDGSKTTKAAGPYVDVKATATGATAASITINGNKFETSDDANAAASTVADKAKDLYSQLKEAGYDVELVASTDGGDKDTVRIKEAQEAQKGVQIGNTSNDKWDVNFSASTKGKVTFQIDANDTAGTAAAKDTPYDYTINYVDANGEKKSKTLTIKDSTATPTATTLGDALKNAINGDSELSELFSASNDSGTITIESKASGTASGYITGLSSDDLKVANDKVTIEAPKDTGKELRLQFKADDDATTGADPTKINKFTNGDQITIDGKTYQFMSDTGMSVDDGVVKVAIDSSDETQTWKNLKKALSANGVESELTDDKKGLRFVDKPAEEVTEKSGGLRLQIGDTAQDFNMMTVSVNDMHTKAMKYTAAEDATGYMKEADGMTLADIDISSQNGAAKAMAVIKNATNYVSDVRGSLGALQNRLDHTIKNLSVSEENITEAESTIRDTDIAKEMMSYTKNNILVQSAQAMLAQANQLPQGVLQLLG